MAKDAFYFSHDSNARNDPKMIKARRMGGLEIVGMYWCVVEMLREAENHELSIDSIEDICFDLRLDASKFEILFITGLLTQNESVFYSNSLKNRMKRREDIVQKRKDAGQLGGKRKASAKQVLSNTPPIKGKESKVKESKVKEINIPHIEDFVNYAVENKPDVDVEAVRLKYKAWEESEWKDGKDQPIKNWKTKLLNTLPYLIKKEGEFHQSTREERMRQAFA